MVVLVLALVLGHVRRPGGHPFDPVSQLGAAPDEVPSDGQVALLDDGALQGVVVARRASLEQCIHRVRPSPARLELGGCGRTGAGVAELAAVDCCPAARFDLLP